MSSHDHKGNHLLAKDLWGIANTYYDDSDKEIMHEAIS